MPILILIAGLIILILLTVYVKIDAFISFLIVAILVGLAGGMDPLKISSSIERGIGSTLGSLAIILGFGAMLGKIVADSGAAQRISVTFIEKFGSGNAQWALMVAGFLIGVPLFYSVGFVLLVPLVCTIAFRTKTPVIFLGMPMITALSVTHCILPPHPAPAALVQQLGADMGQTIMWGTLMSIPMLLVAGPLFSKTLKNIKSNPLDAFFDKRELKKEEMPGFGISLFTALFPVLLMVASSAAKQWEMKEGVLLSILNFAGDPTMALVLAVLLAMYTLGIRQGKKIPGITASMVEGIKSIVMIMLVIAGAGALKEVLTDTGLNSYLADILKNINVSPVILGWGMAALIRIAIGSATVAGLTTAGIIAPLMIQTGANPVIMVLAVGSGSIIFSHVNDSGFWLFKEYFNLSIWDTIRTWSFMETILSVCGLIVVLILNLFIS
ncbi:MAG TPA: gluconate:H+ symporter [Cyclobacteriaceae bacterium]|nr:gluconate:H+ symporter [Cyclobacteriaceae bacterium]